MQLFEILEPSIILMIQPYGPRKVHIPIDGISIPQTEGALYLDWAYIFAEISSLWIQRLDLNGRDSLNRPSLPLYRSTFLIDTCISQRLFVVRTTLQGD